MVFFEGNFQKKFKGGRKKLRRGKNPPFSPPYFPNKWIKGGKTPEIQFPPLIEGHDFHRECHMTLHMKFDKRRVSDYYRELKYSQKSLCHLKIHGDCQRLPSTKFWKTVNHVFLRFHYEGVKNYVTILSEKQPI